MRILKYLCISLTLCAPVIAEYPEDGVDKDQAVLMTQAVSQEALEEDQEIRALLTEFINEEASEGKEIYQAMVGKQIEDLEPLHFEKLLEDMQDGDLYDFVAQYFEEKFPEVYAADYKPHDFIGNR